MLKGEFSTRRFTLPGLRWWIIALIFVATVINFLDRLTISVLAEPICKALDLSNEQFARINIWFLVAYTISHMVSGRIYDQIGVKRGLAWSIVIWSSAAMAHAFAFSIGSLSELRAMLGLGEAGNWPASAKVIAEWFPIRERAVAMGIFNCGPSLGSVVAPPLIVWLNVRYGWQSAFLVTGGLGFVWLTAWVWFYQPLGKHRLLSECEGEFIRAGQVDDGGEILPAEDAKRWTWRELAGYRAVWGLVCSRLLVDPVWWLYILWLPKYLGTERHLSLEQAGWGTSIPFLAAGVGCIFGGWGSGFLIGRGWSVGRARKAMIILAGCLMPAGMLAPYATSVAGALTWISFVTFGFQVWINNVQTLPSDIFPQNAVATVAGMAGFGAGIGSIVFTQTTGWAIDHFSYTPIFITAGLLGPIGTLILLGLIGRVKRI